MSRAARGTFDVTVTPQPPDDSGIGRFDLAKTWSGDLTGTGHGQMLSAGDPAQGRAGYVALEVVEGTLHGRVGLVRLPAARGDARRRQELHYARGARLRHRRPDRHLRRPRPHHRRRGHAYQLTYMLD